MYSLANFRSTNKSNAVDVIHTQKYAESMYGV